MDSFAGRIAVVTGGGSGMGRELVRLLAAEGCHVAMCDLSQENMDDTILMCGDTPAGTRITAFVADVSDETQVSAFAEAVARDHAADHINLLFNNAGIGGGGSFVVDDRAEWEKTFAVCWGGVYNCARAFMPMLLASTEGHVVNTSSLNGFWASLGPTIPHTAYSAAKFAVKGFTEALISDFRVNAPHLKASVVMPGHIGTAIAINSARVFGRDPKELSEQQLIEVRARMAAGGVDVSGASDEDLRQAMQQRAEAFRDNAPTTAVQAAKIILDAVRAGEWRILVGDDAILLDRMVRADPTAAYEPDFMARVIDQGALHFTQG